MNNELIVITTPLAGYERAMVGLLSSLRENSRRNYRQTVEDFMRFLQDKQYTERGLSPATAFQEYMASLQDRKLSGRYIQAKRVHLRRFFEWCFREELMNERDLANVMAVTAPKVQGNKAGNWLTPDQVQQMIDQIDSSTLRGRRDRALIVLLYVCGLRRGEVCQLTWGHLVKVGDHWAIKNLSRKHGKTQPYVPVSDDVMKALEAYQPRGKDNERIFSSIDKHGHIRGSITGDALRKIIVSYAEKLGFGTISPHDMRRTSARAYKQAGVELGQI